MTPFSVGLLNGGPAPIREGLGPEFSIKWEADESERQLVRHFPSHSQRPLVGHPARLSKKFLQRNPVQVLIVDQGRVRLQAKDQASGQEPLWLQWLQECEPSQQPAVVWHILGEKSIWRGDDAIGRPTRKTMQRLGYEQRCSRLQATAHGSAVTQSRLMVVYLRTSAQPWTWPRASTGPARPMANLLRPYGIPPRAWRRSMSDHDKTQAPNSSFDPMPDRIDALIQTPKGTRVLLADELGKGLGISDVSRDPKIRPPSSLITGCTGIHLWAAMRPSLANYLRPITPVDVPDPPLDTRTYDAFSSTKTGEWKWSPPDLSLGSPWWCARVETLSWACRSYSDRSRRFQQGLEALDIHRNNYGPEGPQQLQLLWWEFPPEHWRELQEGFSMNFLREPPPGLVANADMTPAQKETAALFYGELKQLKVLRPPTEEVLATTPLFCLPKAGQPGEWRVLANMKEGGQNTVIGQDPVFLMGSDAILPRLYTGGWSAMADASKMFYQFPTRPDERKYMGCECPLTGEMNVYAGLPMGSGNSPAVAGRAGASLVRLLRRFYPEVFGGRPLENTWHAAFNGRAYDPKLGHGFVLLSDADGLPPVLIFVHVDDFMLHGPTYEKTCRALDIFMDVMLRAGFLFNPAKLTLPCQRVKYTGFLYDTVDQPKMLIPDDKTDRALAMIDIVTGATGPVSRLVLTVLNGTLQSLVPCTPSRIGNTFLRRAYDLLYAGADDPAAINADVLDRLDTTYNPADHLYSCVELTSDVRLDYAWWQTALSERLLARPARPRYAASLTPTWGDGSGTGTGGTIRRFDCETQRQMWMGQWLPAIVHHTSNWRELRTLHLTLQHLHAAPDADRLRETVVFYFTDNSTTYFIVNKGSSKFAPLQTLVYEIKILEVQLGIFLEVVHIPGRIMIVEGTDGLSRGLWIDRATAASTVVMSEVFAPLPYSPELHGWVRGELGLQPGVPLLHRHWSQLQMDDLHLHRLTLWLPPPEMARTLLCHLLLLWVESPWDTGIAILLPRVLQRQWMSLS